VTQFPLCQNPRRSDHERILKDIESFAVKNDDFRQVLYTAKHYQLVVMALKPKEE
jgi:hypothetical protein